MKARSNLLALRDNAFFEKLKQSFGIVPQDDKKHLLGLPAGIDQNLQILFKQ